MKPRLFQQEGFNEDDVLASMESSLRYLDSIDLKRSATHLSMAIELLKEHIKQSTMD